VPGTLRRSDTPTRFFKRGKKKENGAIAYSRERAMAPHPQGPLRHGRPPVIGDRDGIVVISEAELLALLDRGEEVQRTEEAVMRRLEQGECLLDMLNCAAHWDALE
jgi:hypothetical protein